MNIPTTHSQISMIAYILYCKDWVTSHITAERQIKTICQYADYVKECKEDDVEAYTFDDWLSDVGYDGEMYACYDEFYDTEYKECPEYIHSLLKDTKLIALYHEDIDNITNKDVMFILANDNNVVIEQVLMPLNDKDQAKQELSSRLRQRKLSGSFKFGFIDADTAEHIYLINITYF